MRVACVLVTHLRARVELHRRPSLKAAPIVVVGRDRGRAVVLNALPESAGPVVGMPVEEALSRQAGTVVIEADEPAYRRTFRQMLEAMQGVSDRVEAGDLGVAYVVLDGLSEMYGGEARLAVALLGAVPDYLRPRVGLADGKFSAFVAARTAAALGAVKVPPDVEAFLAPHSVDLLPIANGVKEAMHRFDLHTLGDVASWRVRLLVDQFGDDGRLAWELARGVDRHPLAPMKYEEAVTERLAMPPASASLEMLMAAVDRLLQRTFTRPDVRGRYAGWTALRCSIAEGASWEKTVHFRRSVGRWEEAAAILRGQLASDHPTSPVEELTLTLGALSGGSAVQMGLLPDARKDRRERLVEVDRQLQARSNGRHALYRVAELAPWHPAPEMRALRTPIDPLARDAMQPIAAPVAVDVQEGRGHRPEAVRVGREWRRVAHVQDYWRFDLWWTPEPTSRAYYSVVRDDGGQVTLFRDLRDGCWYRQRA